MSFASNLDAAVKAYEKRIDQTIRKVCLDLTSGIILKTPVDTGRARANWQTSINTPSSGVLDSTDKSGGGAIASSMGDIAKATGNIFYLSNNLPYIYRLEFEGWSKQAPAGMVRVTVNDVVSTLR